MKYNLKSSSGRLTVLSARILSAAIIGLTFALMGSEIIEYGTFSFVFVLMVFASLFMALTKGWRLGSLLIFDLIFVLLGLVLRMYVLIAPEL